MNDFNDFLIDKQVNGLSQLDKGPIICRRKRPVALRGEVKPERVCVPN